MLALVYPVVASATITGPCTATGTTSSNSTSDLTTDTEWHMLSTDTAGGSGESTVAMKHAVVRAYAFGGLSLPIAEGDGDGDTSGSVDGLSARRMASPGAGSSSAAGRSGD